MRFLFPKTIFALINSLHEQIKHIGSEYVEMIKEWNDEKLGNTDVEIVDIMHSCSTYLEIRRSMGIDVDALILSVVAKNERRGYYDHSSVAG